MSDIQPKSGLVSASFGAPMAVPPTDKLGELDLNELASLLSGLIFDQIADAIDQRIQNTVENYWYDLPDEFYQYLQQYLITNNYYVQNPYFAGRGIDINGQIISTNATLFEVQSAATGDGVYNCYKQSLDATEWADTAGDDKFDDYNAVSVEVLNLLENDPVASYTPALGKYDRIKAWQFVDDEDNTRWVGIPLTPQVRMVKATEAAGAATNITCNLILNNDVEAGAGELGYNIEVYAKVCGAANLNSASPRIADDNELAAQNIQGKWWFITTFQKTGPC